MNHTPEPTPETSDAPLIDETEIADPIIDERDKVHPEADDSE